MNIFKKAQVLCHFVRWRLTWGRCNTEYCFTIPDNPKFVGVRDAVKLINDGDVVWLSGMAGNARLSIVYRAILESFKEGGHPRDLTYVSVGALGGRGMIPGTLEELGIPGLSKGIITSHTETYKSFNRLAEAGEMELQIIPLGIMTKLLLAMGEGEDFVVTETGVGTFVDPRVGRGSPLTDNGATQYVSAENGALRYSCPKPNVAIFNAPAADRKGNIYMKNSVLLCENYEATKAVKANNGTVIANVGLIVDEGYDDVFIPAEDVDAIVYHPDTEQTISVPHRKPWRLLALNSDVPLEEGLAQVDFVNKLIGITPKRTKVDQATARLGAAIFAEYGKKGASVDVGVGLPEEVTRQLNECGASDDITLFSETGVFGGVQAPGIFFGTAVNPTEIVSSAEAFNRMYKGLDAAVLGMLQADSQGNVNVSKRGEGPKNYVGPGGFIDITTCADMIVFIGSWMAGGEVVIEEGAVHVAQRGKPKFVDQVDEITFSGSQALKKGKKVFYVTNVGAFELTERGMELIRVMPGIDIQSDIIDPCPMRIVLPENGNVPVADASIITGQGFRPRVGA